MVTDGPSAAMLAAQQQSAQTGSTMLGAPRPEAHSGPLITVSDGLLILFNALLALFTFLLWRATAGLWNATKGMLSAAREQAIDFKASVEVARHAADAARRSADLAESTLRLTQRPVVALRQMRAEPISSRLGQPTAGFLVWCLWENAGPVVATDCDLDIRYIRNIPDEPADLAAAWSGQPTHGVLAPHANLESARVRIPTTELRDVFLGRTTIVVQAGCRYGALGQEGAPYITEGCYEVELGVDPSDWTVGDNPPISFRIHPEGNRAT